MSKLLKRRSVGPGLKDQSPALASANNISSAGSEINITEISLSPTSSAEQRYAYKNSYTYRTDRERCNKCLHTPTDICLYTLIQNTMCKDARSRQRHWNGGVVRRSFSVATPSCSRLLGRVWGFKGYWVRLGLVRLIQVNGY